MKAFALMNDLCERLKAARGVVVLLCGDDEIDDAARQSASAVELLLGEAVRMAEQVEEALFGEALEVADESSVRTPDTKARRKAIPPLRSIGA